MDMPVTNLTFKTTASFQSWLKRQVKTSFSVPVQMKGSSWSFQYISVTKQALKDMHICEDEAIAVEISPTKRGDRYFAFVEPQRIRSLS